MKQLTNVRKQLMNSQQAELYQRIQAFSLDAADAHLPFSKRLARDNDWTIEYAQRVIDEYKKFIFLAIVANHPVTPSDQVDQVWHLHLLYTRSYWEEFCFKVLQMPLHHCPTQGGSRERHKFDEWYNKTLASYEQFFQESPPVDIWPPSHIRFGRDIRFVRVNTQSNWILPKPRLNFLSEFRLNRSAIFVLSFLLTLSVTGCALSKVANIPNPVKFSLPEFSVFYLSAASLGIFLLGSLARLFRRHEGTFKIISRLLLLVLFSLFLLGISKTATGLFNFKRQEFIGFYFLATLMGLLLDCFVRSWSDFIQRKTQLTSFDKAVKWLTVLSVLILYLLGIGRIILGIYREKPIVYLGILCLIVSIQLVSLLFSKFTEGFSDSCRTGLAIPVFLLIPVCLWPSFRTLGITISMSFSAVVGFLFLSSNFSFVFGNNGGYSSGGYGGGYGGGGDGGDGDSDGGDGDGDGGDGDGDGGDDGDGGCGGCGE